MVLQWLLCQIQCGTVWCDASTVASDVDTMLESNTARTTTKLFYATTVLISYWFWYALLLSCTAVRLLPFLPSTPVAAISASAVLNGCASNAFLGIYVCACMCVVWAMPSRTLRNCCCPTAVLFSWVSLSPPLSILRGRKPHGHRATNPLNMSPPPVNKKWPWILQRNAYKQDLLPTHAYMHTLLSQLIWGIYSPTTPKIQADLRNPTVHVNNLWPKEHLLWQLQPSLTPREQPFNPSSDLALGTYHFSPR